MLGSVRPNIEYCDLNTGLYRVCKKSWSHGAALAIFCIKKIEKKSQIFDKIWLLLFIFNKNFEYVKKSAKFCIFKKLVYKKCLIISFLLILTTIIF